MKEEIYDQLIDKYAIAEAFGNWSVQYSSRQITRMNKEVKKETSKEITPG